VFIIMKDTADGYGCQYLTEYLGIGDIADVDHAETGRGNKEDKGCQQAAEKLLKSFLVANGIAPPVTHDLLLILEMIIPMDAQSEVLRDPLALLMPYAVEIRYPDVSDMPSVEDAKEAREAAGEVMRWLETHLQEKQDKTD